MNGLYQAKQIGITAKGSKYIILQDAPNSLHVSIERAGYTMYDNFENVISEENLQQRINLLEADLMNKFQLGSLLDIKG